MPRGSYLYNHAAEKIDAWRHEYNHFRPHSSFGDMTPMEYIDVWQRQESEGERLPRTSSMKQMPSGQAWPEGMDSPRTSVSVKRNMRKKPEIPIVGCFCPPPVNRLVCVCSTYQRDLVMSSVPLQTGLVKAFI
jgi:hypothetical protein